MMPADAPMNYFVDHLHEVDGIGIHHLLVDYGSAFEVFNTLGSAYSTVWPIAHLVELPAYGKGFGIDKEGRWEQPGTPVLTVGDWTNAIAIGDIKLNDDFMYWEESPARLLAAGPSLVIHDTTFNKLVLVDGCHRALIRARLKWPIPVVVYISPYAHMLIFPSHFVNHALALETQSLAEQ